MAPTMEYQGQELDVADSRVGYLESLGWALKDGESVASEESEVTDSTVGEPTVMEDDDKTPEGAQDQADVVEPDQQDQADVVEPDQQDQADVVEPDQQDQADVVEPDQQDQADVVEAPKPRRKPGPKPRNRGEDLI